MQCRENVHSYRVKVCNYVYQMYQGANQVDLLQEEANNDRA